MGRLVRLRVDRRRLGALGIGRTLDDGHSHAALAAFLLTSCSHTVRRHDWSQYSGPGAEYFHREEVDALDFSDPVEPMNRGVWSANHLFLEVVVDPLAHVYRAIVPTPVR